MRIHPAALVDPKAELDDDVEIGAFSVIGKDVRIGRGCVIGNRVTIMGNVRMGERNRVWDGAVIGSPPQDHSHRSEATGVALGDENTIRECVTINAGTIKGGAVTILGNHNYLMACSHVGHDCCLEDNITMANGVLLGGHVQIARGCFLSGCAAVHHYARIGRLAFVGGNTGVAQDVPPFMMVDGHRAFPRRVNVVGLKRDGFPPERIDAIVSAFRRLYRSRCSRYGVLMQLLARDDLTPEVRELVEFLRETSLDKKGRYLETMRERAAES